MYKSNRNILSDDIVLSCLWANSFYIAETRNKYVVATSDCGLSLQLSYFFIICLGYRKRFQPPLSTFQKGGFLR